MQVQVIGIAWYRPETFDRLRSIFEDGDKLPRTYEEWFAAAEKGRKSLEAGGAKVICVDIDPDKFPKWCMANGMNINSQARIRFCNLMAHEIATARQSSNTIK